MPIDENQAPSTGAGGRDAFTVLAKADLQKKLAELARKMKRTDGPPLIFVALWRRNYQKWLTAALGKAIWTFEQDNAAHSPPKKLISSTRP